MTTVDYYVRSTVLQGKVLTELDAQGGKKVTHVYTGEAVLAEQRNVSAMGNAPAFSEVFWKHQDIITGSYRRTNRSGQEALTIDPPPNPR
jgi:hypothetical protein